MVMELNEKGCKYERVSQGMFSWGLSMSPSLSKSGYVVVYLLKFFFCILNFFKPR